MAQNKLRKLKTINDVTDFLNGAVLGAQVVKTGANGSAGGIGTGLSGLVGTTLIFSQPSAGTVTFVASSGTGGSAHTPNTNPDPTVLLLQDLKLQIQTVMAGLTVRTDSEGRLVIVETTPANGVTVSHTGTANAILGFNTDVDEVGKFYKPATVTTTAPIWTWMQVDGSNSVTVATYE